MKVRSFLNSTFFLNYARMMGYRFSIVEDKNRECAEITIQMHFKKRLISFIKLKGVCNSSLVEQLVDTDLPDEIDLRETCYITDFFIAKDTTRQNVNVMLMLLVFTINYCVKQDIKWGVGLVSKRLMGYLRTG